MPLRNKVLGVCFFLTLILLTVWSGIRLLVSFPPLAAEAHSSWAMNSLWDDGLAEVARYRATRIVYGKPRSFESVYITVKEDFSPTYFAKADAISGANIPVLKLNVISTIPTEYYEYRYLTSVFVKRNNPMNLLKLTNGSQEWCGNTFKEVRNWEPNSRFVFHSYFDGEGDGTLNLDLRPGDLLEDQLPVALRSLPFRTGYQLQTRVTDSLISNRGKVPQIVKASISVQGEESVGEWKVWRVQVKRDQLLQTYWFEQKYPNIMVKFVSGDGRDLILKETTRRRYWPS
jgi:hypothetical protein